MTAEDSGRNRSVAWMGLKYRSLESFNLHEVSMGWAFTGTVIAEADEGFFSVNYRILADEGFSTISASVRLSIGVSEKVLAISHERDSWTVNGNIQPDLEGCEGIDLEIAPSTNTLPIRRTDPTIGQEVQVSSAWVRFPSLETRRLEQTYERIGKNNFIYRSRNFESTMEVDEFSIPTKYDGIWEVV